LRADSALGTSEKPALSGSDLDNFQAAGQQSGNAGEGGWHGGTGAPFLGSDGRVVLARARALREITQAADMILRLPCSIVFEEVFFDLLNALHRQVPRRTS